MRTAGGKGKADGEDSDSAAAGKRVAIKDPAVAPRDVAAAAALGQWKKIAEWLQDGGLPNSWYVSSWGTRWTLMMAAAAGNQALTIKMLIKVSADLDLVSEVGFSALMYAVRRGHLSAAEVLVNAGADIGLQSPAGAKQSGEDVGGWTAQILAVSCPSNRAELAKLLGRGDRPGPDQPRPPYVPFDMMDELTELAELASVRAETAILKEQAKAKEEARARGTVRGRLKERAEQNKKEGSAGGTGGGAADEAAEAEARARAEAAEAELLALEETETKTQARAAPRPLPEHRPAAPPRGASGAQPPRSESRRA